MCVYVSELLELDASGSPKKLLHFILPRLELVSESAARSLSRSESATTTEQNTPTHSLAHIMTRHVPSEPLNTQHAHQSSGVVFCWIGRGPLGSSVASVAAFSPEAGTRPSHPFNSIPFLSGRLHLRHASEMEHLQQHNTAATTTTKAIANQNTVSIHLLRSVGADGNGKLAPPPPSHAHPPASWASHAPNLLSWLATIRA